MKLTTKLIRSIQPDSLLMLPMEDRKTLNAARNLISYVNLTYPVPGYRYTTHEVEKNVLQISLIPRTDETAQIKD